MKIIIEADSKEIADLVLTLQSQRNQDEIAKNYAIDIFGNKSIEYESGGRGCPNGMTWDEHERMHGKEGKENGDNDAG